MLTEENESGCKEVCLCKMESGQWRLHLKEALTVRYIMERMYEKMFDIQPDCDGGTCD